MRQGFQEGRGATSAGAEPLRAKRERRSANDVTDRAAQATSEDQRGSRRPSERGLARQGGRIQTLSIIVLMV